MEKIITITQVIAPIFVAVFLGILAKQKKLLTPEHIQGLQQFVINFGLPCVIFNSCLTANIGAESLSSMALTLPFVVIATLAAKRETKELGMETHPGEGVIKEEKFPNTRKPSHRQVCGEFWDLRGQHNWEEKINK